MAKIARASAPNDPSVAYTLGWVLYKQNNLEMALKCLKESAEKLPDNAEIQYHLGVTQYKLGNYREAKHTLNHLLKKGVEFKESAEARRILEDMATKRD